MKNTDYNQQSLDTVITSANTLQTMMELISDLDLEVAGIASL